MSVLRYTTFWLKRAPKWRCSLTLLTPNSSEFSFFFLRYFFFFFEMPLAMGLFIHRAVHYHFHYASKSFFRAG